MDGRAARSTIIDAPWERQGRPVSALECARELARWPVGFALHPLVFLIRRIARWAVGVAGDTPPSLWPCLQREADWRAPRSTTSSCSSDRAAFSRKLFLSSSQLRLRKIQHLPVVRYMEHLSRKNLYAGPLRSAARLVDLPSQIDRSGSAMCVEFSVRGGVLVLATAVAAMPVLGQRRLSAAGSRIRCPRPRKSSLSTLLSPPSP
jgi:hypothetical protein